MSKLEYNAHKKTLSYQGTEFKSQFFGSEFIGFCGQCEGRVVGEECWVWDEGYVVAGRCEVCGWTVLLVFDPAWELAGERGVDRSTTEVSDFEAIPVEYLKAVFTPAEIEAMKNKYNNKKYSRQNLYRARKKYEKFKLLFNIELNI